MKFNSTLMTSVQADMESNVVPMLLGEPGIGKSSWVMALGELMHTQVFVLACNQLADKADMTGARLVPTEDKSDYEQRFYPHAVINQAIAYAEDHPRETPILFMDELNRTTPDVTSEALSIPTLRALGSRKLPDNLKVITAGNDKGNITSLDQASITRFSLYHVEPDVNTYLSLDQNLNPFVKDVLTHHPETIFCKTVRLAKTKTDDDDTDAEVDINEILDDGEEMQQIATPRTITGVSNWLNRYTNTDLMNLLGSTSVIDGEEVCDLQQLLEAHTGRTDFTTYLLEAIANGVATVNNQSNVALGKPSCYDAMKACPSMDALSDFIDTMSENDKGGCLVYLVYEKADNAKFIRALAAKTPTLPHNDLKSLVSLGMSGKMDDGNLQTLLSTNTTYAQKISYLFDQGN